MSRDAPPPLPGGYKVGEKVFFTGASHTFDDGNKLVHGQQGEVTGPAINETHTGKGVAILFPGNKSWVDCYLTSVRRHCAPPAATPPAYAPHATLYAYTRAAVPPSTRPQLQATAAAVALARGHGRTAPLCL